MPLVALALGSNMDPQRHLRRAAALLREAWPTMRFSSVYETAAMGMEDQADFLNAVGVTETDDPPERVRQICRSIESALKKNVAYRWGPRTIDLDLLLYGDTVLPNQTAWHRAECGEDATGTVVPHPRMHRRRFVLDPLRDVLPDGPHPILGTTWDALRGAVAEQRIRSIGLLI